MKKIKKNNIIIKEVKDKKAEYPNYLPLQIIITSCSGNIEYIGDPFYDLVIYPVVIYPSDITNSLNFVKEIFSKNILASTLFLGPYFGKIGEPPFGGTKEIQPPIHIPFLNITLSPSSSILKFKNQIKLLVKKFLKTFNFVILINKLYSSNKLFLDSLSKINLTDKMEYKLYEICNPILVKSSQVYKYSIRERLFSNENWELRNMAHYYAFIPFLDLSTTKRKQKDLIKIFHENVKIGISTLLTKINQRQGKEDYTIRTIFIPSFTIVFPSSLFPNNSNNFLKYLYLSNFDGILRAILGREAPHSLQKIYILAKPLNEEKYEISCHELTKVLKDIYINLNGIKIFSYKILIYFLLYLILFSLYKFTYLMHDFHLKNIFKLLAKQKILSNLKYYFSFIIPLISLITAYTGSFGLAIIEGLTIIALGICLLFI